jgi:hypothetical protein
LDRRRARAGRLILALGAAVAAAALAAETERPLRAQRWLAAGPDMARALSLAPRECLTRPPQPQEALAVEVGRAAFRTPVLLGGQAARAGLSCESCHQAGRDNPRFQFPGVSGAPGTADVTSSLLSTHRGNGTDDPRTIPDLSGPRSGLKVDQARESRALESFIRGLVVEEFDGPEPAPAVLGGLAAYVRALEPSACPAEADEPLSAGLYLEDARRAARAATTLAARGDRDAARLMVAAARARLGLIDERFAGPDLAAVRARLRGADRALAQAAEALRAGRPAQRELAAWLAGSEALERALARREAASLFNPARLKVAVSSALPSESR